MNFTNHITPRMLGMAEVGERVRFLNANGYPYELNEAQVCFEPDEVLTVAEVCIGSFSSTYRFEGRGEALWNTVMFEPQAIDADDASIIAEAARRLGRLHRRPA
jgi:hypothetical protein